MTTFITLTGTEGDVLDVNPDHIMLMADNADTTTGVTGTRITLTHDFAAYVREPRARIRELIAQATVDMSV